MFEALLSGLIAGFLWLDRYQLFQLLLSRPIICAPITGLILGNLAAGCTVGLMYELLWLRRPPVGGYIAPDTTLASISATTIAILLIGNTPVGVLSSSCLAFVTTYPLTIVASRYDIAFRIILGKLAILAENAIIRNGDQSVISYMLTGLVLAFLSAFFLVVFYVLAGFHALSWLIKNPLHNYFNSLEIGFYVILMISIADLIGAFADRFQTTIFVMGLALTMTICYALNLI